MAGKANPCGKTRPVKKPYEIWTSRDGSWEHRVLKKYQVDDNKRGARWFVAVKSPLFSAPSSVRFIAKHIIYDGWEYGDSYVSDVKSGNTRTYVDPTLSNI